MKLHRSTLKFQVLTVALIILSMVIAACGSDDDSDSKSSSDNQNDKSYTVGVINLVPPVFGTTLAGFQSKMTELGYTEGENITYIVVQNDADLAPVLADNDIDLVLTMPGRPVDTGDVPHVFALSSAPIENNLVESLDKPGKNTTGVLIGTAIERRFQLFVEMLPDVNRILVPYDATNVSNVTDLVLLQTTADNFAKELIVVEMVVTDADQVAEAIAQISDHEVDAIFILETNAAIVEWLTASFQHQLPSSISAVSVEPNAVMAYGPELYAMGEQAAGLADQILRGANAGDLPVETAEFFLSIDLTIASAIGVEVPDSILGQAATIIRGEPYVLPITATPEESDNETDMVAGVGACQTDISSPGGTNAACVTSTCGSVADGTMIKYDNRVDVEACTTENLVGICSTDDFDTYYYDGAAAGLQTGCGFSSGTWSDGVE